MINTGVLFSRAYELALGPKSNAKAFLYGNTGESGAGLRIAFSIDKNMQGNANTSKVVLYNLSQDARNNIGKGWLVRLSAGYVGQLGVVFIGNVTKAVSERSGSSITTTLDLMDGGAAITYASINKSYGNNVTLSQILKDVASAMSLKTALSPDGINAGIAVDIPNITYPLGFVAHGLCRDVLTTLLKPQGIEWNVQNGALNLVPLATTTSKSAVVISPQTGMIGIPTVNDKTVQFTSLINPRLLPGALVQIKSDTTNLGGYYKIRDCKIEGDSHDQNWQTVAQCTPIKASEVTRVSNNSFAYG